MASSRLARATFSLIFVLIAYTIYSIVVVPLVEPPRVTATDETRRAGAHSIVEDEFRVLLRELFPPTSWEATNPKILRNDKAALLFQEFQQAQDGEISLKPCTVVLLRDPVDESSQPGAPVFLQARNGAVLRFDRPLDLRNGTIGKPVAGRLVGEVRIHSDGVDGRGRLEITTSNVQIDSERIWTTNPVEFQYDGSHGKGRDLIIRLVDPKQKTADRSPLAMMQSIELVHLDELEIDSATSALMSNEKATKLFDGKPGTNKPLRISCRGPCRIEMNKGELVLEDEVDVRQDGGEGIEDFLRCRLLKLLFQNISTPSSANDKESSSRVRGRLGVSRIIAMGEPVVINLSSRSAYVEGSRVEFEEGERVFRVFSDSHATLRHVVRGQGHELHARQFEYQLGAPGSLGALQAAGPGVFQQTSGPSERSLKVSWNKRLDFHRVDQFHVLEIDGQAQAEVASSGGIRAGHITVTLEDAPRMANQIGPEGFSLRPRGFLATDHVRCDSERLRVDCQQLQANFRHEPTTGLSTGNPIASRPVAMKTASSSNAVFRSAQTNDEGQRRPDDPLHGAARNDPVAVAGQSIELWLTLAGHEITRIDKINVNGAESSRGSNQLSRISTRGTIIQAGDIRFDHSTNLIWSDGQGRLELSPQQGLPGDANAAAQQATITWHHRMECDGGQISFIGHIQVAGTDFNLRADRAHAHLSRRIDFGDRQALSRPIEIERLSVEGNVTAEYRETLRGQLESLATFQAPNASLERRSGDIRVRGPGEVTLVRRGFRSASQFSSPSQGDDRQSAWDQRRDSASQPLSFLRIEFQNGMQGNTYKKRMTFDRDIEALYGPVSDWNKQISAEAGLGPDDVLLTADQLIAAQLPGGRGQQSNLDLRAVGNVIVEGQQFTARGHRVSYDQQKDLMVLTGIGQSDASIAVRQTERGTRTETQGREIQFRPGTREIRFNDVRQLDFRTLRK